jgi:membrane associated rhomboid family serine protease
MFQSTPTVKTIFYINLVAFLLTLILPNTMYGIFSLTNANTIYQLISHQFIHANLLHIFFNMLVLLSFGPTVEEYYGSKKMWIYYLACGVAGALLHVAMIHSNSPLVGASGSIWGIMVMFTLLYPEQEMYMFFVPIPIKAKYIVGALFLFEVFGGLKFSNDNVAHFGHIGGSLMGGLLYYLHKKRIID